MQLNYPVNEYARNNSWDMKDCFRRIDAKEIERMLTDSNKDEVTIRELAPELLMFVRMGAPNPIDESWRLIHAKSQGSVSVWNFFEIIIYAHMNPTIPFRNSLFQVYKSTTTYEKNICRVYLQYHDSWDSVTGHWKQWNTKMDLQCRKYLSKYRVPNI